MTTPSKQKQIEQAVNQAFDTSIDEALSEDIRSDIARARIQALNIASSKAPQSGFSSRLFLKFKQIFSIKILVPVAVAASAVMLVNYNYILPTNSSTFIAQVPPLPLAVMDDSIPSEDVLILQDIEFAHWLASQDSETQEVTL